MNKMLTTVAAVCATLPLCADTMTWNVSSGDVNTAANWSPAQVPGASDVANLKSGTATAAADFAVKTL